MIPIFVAVSVSFLLAIIVSIFSLTKLARENTREIDKMLAYRVYDTISSSLNEPIVVSKTMSCDDFLADFLKKEDSMTEDEAIAVMKSYLSSIKNGLEYDSAFLVSEGSSRYYTYEGLNKIVDPENDAHDIWYSLFIEKDSPYDLDVDSDEMNQGQWTVFVNARIEDEKGKLLGVCGVGVQMTNLQELFLTSEQEYGVKINFVDKNGLVQVDTEDVNIENAWLGEEILSQTETDEYNYRITENNEFVVTKYVEYLGWYLVVRSAPTTINREFVNIIFLNAVLFLLVMAILIFTVAVILGRSKREREAKEKLLIVSERALAASEAKSSFLSSMSHEIRTPINAVLGMNEMILRETDDERILEYSGNIRNAGKTLLALINSILDFSKIEEGKMEIVPVEYCTASMINNLVISVIDRAKSKGLDFIVDVDKTLPSGLIGDDVRLSQVIMNILTNAVKYTEKGHIRFTIRKDHQEGDSIWLYVAVEDTGIGIRDEDRQKLFASFERLDEVKNHSIEGTGLGMSIVTNLLKLMDSEIYVDSKYGIGSTFYFVIRQQVSDKTPIGDYTQRTAKSRKLDGLELFHAPDAKILVVDDNDMNLKVAGNLLGLFGIRPKMVGSGSEAIDCVKTENYHMILLDHMMPKMDGIETLRKMRSDKLLPKDAKVIALTANAVNGARDRYLSAGFDDYLSKPIEVSGLEELLKKYLPRDVLEKTEDAAKEDGIMEFDPVPEDYEVSDLDTSLDAEKIMIDKLKGLDLDTEAALSFCAGEFALYEEILGDYVKACKDRKEELDACCKNADWHEFEVKVHALKSTSKTIGAIELYERALSLEEAAEKKDEDYIRENYPAFEQDYQELALAIEEIIETNKYLPKDKIEEGTQKKTIVVDGKAKVAEQEFPLIDGMDLAYADLHIPNRELLMTALRDFYQIIDVHADKLDEMYGRLPDRQSFADYRVLVHGMKSSAATIGIVPLAGMAKVLENAAGQEDEETIRHLHADFLTVWRGYGKEFSAVFGFDAETVRADEGKDGETFDAEAVSGLLEIIRIAMEDFDIDRADEAMRKLSTFACPETVKKELHALAASITDVDDEGADEAICHIKDLLTKM